LRRFCFKNWANIPYYAWAYPVEHMPQPDAQQLLCFENCKGITIESCGMVFLFNRCLLAAIRRRQLAAIRVRRQFAANA
jgi:hypothetical protein